MRTHDDGADRRRADTRSGRHLILVATLGAVAGGITLAAWSLRDRSPATAPTTRTVHPTPVARTTNAPVSPGGNGHGPRTAPPRWRSRLAAAAVVAIGIATGGVAVAAWSVSGEGEGAVGAASAESLAEVRFVLEGDLYPGLTAGATLTVDNPNIFPVSITDIEFGTVVITGGDGCTLDNAQVAFADMSGLDLFLAASTKDIAHVLTDVVTMGLGSDDGCQDATFTAPMTLTGQSTTAP